MPGEYLAPGRALDAEVAKRVFGDDVQLVGYRIPQYSESYADMELLVDKLVADHWYFHVARSYLGDCPWWCSMFKSSAPKEQGEVDDEEYSAVGLSLPHVLALTAAKAYLLHSGVKP